MESCTSYRLLSWGRKVKDKMRFVCDEHGEFEPDVVFYSLPAQAQCPVCCKMVEDKDGKIPIAKVDDLRTAALKSCVPIFADHEDAKMFGEAYVDHQCDCEACKKLPHTAKRPKGKPSWEIKRG